MSWNDDETVEINKAMQNAVISPEIVYDRLFQADIMLEGDNYERQNLSDKDKELLQKADDLIATPNDQQGECNRTTYLDLRIDESWDDYLSINDIKGYRSNDRYGRHPLTDENINVVKDYYKNKFERLSLTNKIIIKELFDHKLIKTGFETLKTINEFSLLEGPRAHIVEDEVSYTLDKFRENLKAVKLHNILQMQTLIKSIKEENQINKRNKKELARLEEDFNLWKEVMNVQAVKAAPPAPKVAKKQPVVREDDEEAYVEGRQKSTPGRRGPGRKLRKSRQKKVIQNDEYSLDEYD